MSDLLFLGLSILGPALIFLGIVTLIDYCTTKPRRPY